ncbi:coadhesin-like [Oculina patagonica]
MDVQYYLTGLIFLLLVVDGNSQDGAVDGGYSDWSEFSECNVSCGGGLKIRKRSCNSPEPRNGGRDCSGLGPDMETEACNSFPCPVHGGYSEWSNFTKCSVTCGGGFQSRTRTCTNPLPCCGGKNCDDLGPSVETQKCGTCDCVTDGEWSEWCPFTPCSASCGGGVRHRTRTCTNPPPQGGGQDCQGPDSESQKCNTQPCGGGKCTEWSEWSDCSVTCGTGAQKRTRDCTGANTLGPETENKECSLTPCPIDGNYTEWTEWTDCSVTCGGDFQSRSRSCTNPPPQYGGKNCDELGSARQAQECNPDPCPIDGNYTQWTGWSDCSATCGGGSQKRSRNCTNPSPQYGGKNCDILGPAGETQECNPDPCPMNGNYTEWTEWSDCSVTCGGDFQTRSRSCTNPPPEYGGKNCDELGPAFETQDCNPDPCPIDGNFTEWTEWSDCSATCGGGSQTRSRNCTNPPPQYGGKNCDELGPADQKQNCNPDPCPIDGNYTAWTEWSDCSVTCGGGSQTRSRSCTNPPPQNGGKNCDELGPGDQTQECNPDPCPIDGNYTAWTEWSDCSATCGGGSQTRSRSCTNPPPQNGGKNCVELGPADQKEECNPDPCLPPCSIGFDIGVVVDTSKSVKKSNLKKVFAFLIDLVETFEPGPDKDHFGLVTFNRRAFTKFTFADKTLYSVEALESKIGNIPLTLDFQTRTDLAMIAARDSLFSLSGGDRPNNPNIMIMLTDGKPTKMHEDFAVFTARFHNDPEVSDWHIIAVGIGSGINQETLREIAGKNGDVIIVENFDLLVNQLVEIKHKMCAAQ